MSAPLPPDDLDPCDLWTGPNNHGYGQMMSDGKWRYVHILAWESVHGPVPDGYEIDHKCRNRSCRNINHLRLATHSQNHANREKPSGAYSSRFKGVSWEKRRSKWAVKIMCAGTLHWVGYFDNEITAARAYDMKALELFGEFACLNLEVEDESSSAA